MGTVYGDIKDVEKLSFFKTSSNTNTTIVTYRYKYIFNSDKKKLGKNVPSASIIEYFFK